METKYVKIPSAFKVGGARMEVRRVERCEDNCLGTQLLARGYVEIADRVNKDDVQSDDCKINTFYHELTHSILRTMGEDDLNNNEKFVCCFSSFLTEAMEKAYFLEDQTNNEQEKPPEPQNRGLNADRAQLAATLACSVGRTSHR